MSNLFRVEIRTNKYQKGEDSPYYWCHQRFGTPFTKKWHVIRYGNCDIYYFSNEDDYTLFMLTWG